MVRFINNMELDAIYEKSNLKSRFKYVTLKPLSMARECQGETGVYKNPLIQENPAVFTTRFL
jgi:hypothetical protein